MYSNIWDEEGKTEKKLFRKSTLSSGEISVAKYSQIERMFTITCMKHENQPVMNGRRKMRLKKKVIVDKEELIMKKEMENKEKLR